MDIIKFAEEELLKHSEEEYRKFSSSITPNVDNILGVRIPKLREIAKKITKIEPYKFLKGEEKYMETTMLKGLVITYLKASSDEMYGLIKDFVPRISNWAVCDIFCGGLKFMRKDPDRAIKFLAPYLKSKDEFRLRFGVVCLLSHFIDNEHIDFVLDTLFNLKNDKYYAQMGIAWAVSICYIKFPKETLKRLKGETAFDDFTFNKSISKICDSFRVSKEEKERLKKLRR